MRFLIFAILLAFPFLEIAVLIELSQRYGWWVLVYLLTIAYLGLKLIRNEKDLIAARMFQQMGAGGNPLAAMFSTARNMFAGVLLLIPGVISDVIAVILLLLPAGVTPATGAQSGPFTGRPSANDEVIEGEFTEVREHSAREPANGNVVQLPPRKDS
ncbi:FxsA family protein [Methylophilus aquaticus]|uniref:FxsA family protein n=1 Tax=Methylophilus aquaticus TaxID=1971610 RepID=A0ABT9JTP5_9PROT|nr:FxsA family protein [Methylophilus aquaticus]MDP8567906.1 FxsA family protein [Methylophilus aquaticus]